MNHAKESLKESKQFLKKLNFRPRLVSTECYLYALLQCKITTSEPNFCQQIPSKRKATRLPSRNQSRPTPHKVKPSDVAPQTTLASRNWLQTDLCCSIAQILTRQRCMMQARLPLCVPSEIKTLKQQPHFYVTDYSFKQVFRTLRNQQEIDLRNHLLRKMHEVHSRCEYVLVPWCNSKLELSDEQQCRKTYLLSWKTFHIKSDCSRKDRKISISMVETSFRILLHWSSSSAQLP